MRPIPPSGRDGTEHYIRPTRLHLGDEERRSWRSFLQRIGLKQTQAFLHRQNGSIVCEVTPNRFTSGGTLYINNEEHIVRFENRTWTVSGEFLNMEAFKLNDTQILITDFRAENPMPVMLDYLLWQIGNGLDAIYRIYSVTYINPRLARRGRLIAQFGDNTWNLQLYRNIPEESFAFFFFLYIVSSRKQRRWSWFT